MQSVYCPSAERVSILRFRLCALGSGSFIGTRTQNKVIVPLSKHARCINNANGIRKVTSSRTVYFVLKKKPPRWCLKQRGNHPQRHSLIAQVRAPLRPRFDFSKNTNADWTEWISGAYTNDPRGVWRCPDCAQRTTAELRKSVPPPQERPVGRGRGTSSSLCLFLGAMLFPEVHSVPRPAAVITRGPQPPKGQSRIPPLAACYACALLWRARFARHTHGASYAINGEIWRRHRSSFRPATEFVVRRVICIGLAFRVSLSRWRSERERNTKMPRRCQRDNGSASCSSCPATAFRLVY